MSAWGAWPDLRTCRLPRACTIVEATQRLLSALPAGAGLPAARLAVPLDEGLSVEEAAAWLGGREAGTRALFSDRDGDVVLCGVGRARVEGGIDAARLLPDGAQALFWARFDEEQPPRGAWARFGAGLALPRVCLQRSGRSAFLAVHDDLDGPGGAQAAAEARALLVGHGRDAPPLPPPTGARADVPDRDGFAAAVAEAAEAFRAGHLEKVVLARATSVRMAGRVDPVALVAALRARHPGAYLFCVEAGPGRAFVGASPERLFRRDGRAISTEALAGTRPRPTDPVEEAAAIDDLLSAEKDRREHGHVLDHVLAALSPLCARLDAGAARGVVRTRDVLHMRVSVEGTLHEGVDDRALLAALHPTPAVGGAPSPAARRTIAALEPFDRGLYAGPLGVVSKAGAELSVAIRSALVEDDVVTAYSGAGIVKGSDAALEWREIEAKARSVLGPLGAAP